jgi:hypothetical protein
MAQIFRHDNRPADDLGLKLQGPPILSSSRASSARGPSRVALAPVSTSTIAPTVGRPPVVLELPDLAISAEVSSTGRMELVDLLSWIGIGAGALLAVVLIWTAPKDVQRPMDEAPAWDHSVEHRAEETSHPAVLDVPTNEVPPTDDSSTDTAPPVEDGSHPEVEEENAPADREHSLGSPFKERPEQAAAPAGNETQLQAQAAPTTVPQYPANAARPTEAVWDGNASSANPGEAVPVGRITNVAVPP